MCCTTFAFECHFIARLPVYACSSACICVSSGRCQCVLTIQTTCQIKYSQFNHVVTLFLDGHNFHSEFRFVKNCSKLMVTFELNQKYFLHVNVAKLVVGI